MTRLRCEGLAAARGSTGRAGPWFVEPFPQPPIAVQRAINELQIRAEDSMGGISPEFVDLPRPWDPATCDGDLRRELWPWLDAVALWINTQHLWSVDRLGVPPCWPFHPHLVRDLAVVASARFVVSLAAAPAPLEDWHRYALPAFLARVEERLGTSCMSSHLDSSPRAPRDREFADVLRSPARCSLFNDEADARD